MIPTHIDTWQMTEPGQLARTRIPMPALAPGEVVVKIAGCGVCHTDLSYFYLGVPTVQKPPLSLGHEISGVVVGGREDMIGKEVVVPPSREPAKIIDIMEALKQSLAIAKKPAASEVALEEAPKEQKTSGKKRAARG